MKLWFDNQETIILHLILSFMKEQSILRLIAILYLRRLKKIRLLGIGHVWTGEQLEEIFTKALNTNRIDYIFVTT